MKNLCLLAIIVMILSAWPGSGLAQTTGDLVNDQESADNVLTLSMGYDRKSYSPLDEINRSNVKRLVPIWNASMSNDLGELAAPVV